MHVEETALCEGLLTAAPIVIDVSLNKRKGWHESKIEMLANFQVGNDSQVKARASGRFNPHDAVTLQKSGRPEWGITRTVERQRDAKIVWLLIEIKIIPKVIPTCLVSIFPIEKEGFLGSGLGLGALSAFFRNVLVLGDSDAICR